MLKVFCAPARYTQGRNATAEPGPEIAAPGLKGPALIIASRSVVRLLVETWKESLYSTEIRFAVFTADAAGERFLAA